MASRIVHIAIANEIMKLRPIKDRERFLLGSVLPDACSGREPHFSLYVDGGTKKTFDLTGFRAFSGGRLPHDELYAGYYLHLLTDILHRHLMYDVIGYKPVPKRNVEQLHLDYALTNRYIILEYGLELDFSIPPDIENEPLLRAFDFDLSGFFNDMKKDFAARPVGKPVFFTEKSARDLIAFSVPKCVAELDALNNGGVHFDEKEYAWKRFVKG